MAVSAPQSLHNVMHHKPGDPVELREFYRAVQKKEGEKSVLVPIKDYRVCVAQIKGKKAQDSMMDTVHDFSLKVCNDGNIPCSFMLDLSEVSSPPSKETISKQLQFDESMKGKPTNVKKVAIVVCNMAVQGMLTLYFKASSTKMPTQVFNNKKDAWEWCWTTK